MPYISNDTRSIFDNEIDRIRAVFPNAGELNYIISRLLDGYLANQGMKYSSINTLIGVLECAKLELYRRIASPYEDRKIRESGDVYTV